VAAKGYQLAYQWQRAPFSLSGQVWSDVPGATDATYAFTPVGADNLAGYRVVVTNPWGTTTSNAVGLTLYYPPTSTTQPLSRVVKTGTAVLFSAAASSLTATPAPQWQRSTDGGATWSDITGATTNSYLVSSPQPADSGTRYRVAYSGNGLTSYTNAATLTVDDTAPVPRAVVVGGVPTFGIYPGPVTVELAATDENGIPSMTWSAAGAFSSSPATVNGAPRTVTVSAVGTTTITVTGRDAAGNVSASATLTVRIDPRPVLSVAPRTSVLEPDVAGGGAYVQITLSQPAATDVTVNWYTRDGTAGGCTSGACDYARTGTASSPKKATIKAGSVQAIVAVQVNPDDLVEPDETFDVVLANPSANAVLSSRSVATARIVDVDAISDGGRPVLLLTPTNDVIEGDDGTARAQVIASLSRPLAEAITLTTWTSGGTAVEGVQYKAKGPSTVTIPAGGRAVTIEVGALANLLADGDRWVGVAHSVGNPSGVDLIDVVDLARVDQLDDDRPD
jgi:hypothetical protein